MSFYIPLTKNKEMIIMKIDKKLLFVSDVASMLNCSSHKVYGLIHSGELEGFKDVNGKVWHISEEALQNYIGNCMNNYQKQKNKSAKTSE